SDEGIEYVFQTFLESEGVKREGHGRTFIFCQPASKGESQVQRVLRISKKFGLNFVVVDDEVSIKERQKLLSQVDSKEIDGVICVRALSVGVDLRSLRHVIMLNTFGGANLFVQVAGRVSRTHSESGKTVAYVHDYAGNVDPGDGSGKYPPIEVLSKELVGDRFRVLSDRASSEGEAPMKECTRCGNEVLTFVVECPYCNEVLCEPKELVDLAEGRMLTVEDLSWLI
ncbi:MAG: DEAD/DEAH box helicase, partial [Alphaproteobacteria bacterium]